ncbi:MAG: RNA polymerase subunit sigma-70, partial [Bacteroidota bacterium]
HKCGLINKANPCRCHRKTAGFIKLGYVDPDSLYFQKNVLSKINEVVEEKVDAYSNEVLSDYQKLYREHPFLRSPDKMKSIKKLLSTESIRRTFNLNDLN